MGALPDNAVQRKAIVASTSLVFAPSNVQGQQYGKPKNYMFRTWNRDDVRATVIFDDAGKVVAKSTFRKEK